MRSTILLVGVTCLMAATPAMAANFDGFYVGAQGGYETFDAQSDFTGAGAFAGDNLSIDLGAEGGNGGIFAGYGKRLGNFYLGAEAEGNLGGADSQLSVTAGGTTAELDIKHKYDYGLTVRPGVFVADNVLAYARAGWIHSKFDDNASDTASLNGLRLGLGAEAALAANVTARLDWAYTSYESKTFTSVDGSTRFSPTSNTFRVGLAYNF